MQSKPVTSTNAEGVAKPKREASLAAPNWYATALVAARKRISEARDEWLKQKPEPGMSEEDYDKWNILMLAYGNGMARARSIIGEMLDETRKSHTEEALPR